MSAPIRRSLLVAVTLLLLAVRLYRLPEGALWSYDAVAHWDVARRVAGGDLSGLFASAAPGAHLLFAAVARITPQFLVLEYVNVLLGVAALWLWSRACARHWGWSAAEQIAGVLWLGTAFFLTSTTREVSGQMAALGLTGGALISLQRKRLSTAGALFGLAVACYYMALTLLPVLVLLAPRGQGAGAWRRAAGVALLPLVGCALVGWLGGVVWFRYPAALAILTVGRLVEPWLPLAAVPDDAVYSAHPRNLLFYLRYFWSFEQPLLLLSLPVAGWAFRRQRWAGWTAVGYVLLMVVVLPRAPRVWLFLTPLLYGVCWTAWRRALPRWSWAVLGLGLLWNGYALVRWVYPYAPTHYDRLADYLHQHQITRLVTTAGRGVEPFAPDVQVVAALTPAAVETQRARGVRYLLVDDYHRVAGIGGFAPYAVGREVWRSEEPSLLLPLLHLEHAEFADRSYAEVMELHAAMRAQTTHLRLLRLE